MLTHCFGLFSKEKEECAYCKVAVECYESSDTSRHPRATQKNLAMEVTK